MKIAGHRAKLIVATLILSVSQAAAAAPRPPLVKTEHGTVRGKLHRGAMTFLGLPYGASTAASARFLPPTSPQKWTGVGDATRYGAKCPQNDLPLPADYKMLIAFADVPQSEDCLSLNLWSPSLNGRKRPVLVWLHGGAFLTGTGAEPAYDGANLATGDDVVVVTLNHRLDLFGFMDLSALSPRYARSGNAGMLDIVLALRWVKANIARFGGDASNVTIFGQSGGGMKVETLLAMPESKGLFHKAVVQSSPSFLRPVRSTEAQARTKKIFENLKVASPTVEQLQRLPVASLLKGSAGVSFTPVADGDVLPATPFETHAPPISADIPLMVGTTADEATIFIYGNENAGRMNDGALRAQLSAMLGPSRAESALALYRPSGSTEPPIYTLSAIMTDAQFTSEAVRVAEQKARQQAAPAYLYRIDWPSPALGGRLRATHGMDMTLWFNNVERVAGLTGTSAEAQRLAKQISSALVAFARTGKPNNPAVLPQWPAYSIDKRQLMTFGKTLKVVADPEAEKRRFWQGN